MQTHQYGHVIKISWLSATHQILRENVILVLVVVFAVISVSTIHEVLHITL